MKPLNEYEQSLRCAYEMLGLKGDSVTVSNFSTIFSKHYTPLDRHEFAEFQKIITDWAITTTIEQALSGPNEHNPLMLADFILQFTHNLSKWRAARDPLDKFMKDLHR